MAAIFSSISAGITTLFSWSRLEPTCKRLSAKRFAASSILFDFFLRAGELPISISVEVDVKIAKTGAVTVRLDPELKGRLAEAAAKLDLSENDIVRHALRAAVNAIEVQDYKIELPLEMVLGKRPIQSRETRLSEPEGKYPKRKHH